LGATERAASRKANGEGISTFNWRGVVNWLGNETFQILTNDKIIRKV